jgi:hypothetical protein
MFSEQAPNTIPTDLAGGASLFSETADPTPESFEQSSRDCLAQQIHRSRETSAAAVELSKELTPESCRSAFKIVGDLITEIQQASSSMDSHFRQYETSSNEMVEVLQTYVQNPVRINDDMLKIIRSKGGEQTSWAEIAQHYERLTIDLADLQKRVAGLQQSI